MELGTLQVLKERGGALAWGARGRSWDLLSGEDGLRSGPPGPGGLAGTRKGEGWDPDTGD